MNYPSEWQGRVRVRLVCPAVKERDESWTHEVYVDGFIVGYVTDQYVAGARSPGGWKIDKRWHALWRVQDAVSPIDGSVAWALTRNYRSMTQAMKAVVCLHLRERSEK